MGTVRGVVLSLCLPSPPSGSLSAGSTLGPYTIRAELRHGGIGVVYTAHAA